MPALAATTRQLARLHVRSCGALAARAEVLEPGLHLGQIAAPHWEGLLIDAAGTLLLPAEPTAAVYLRYARHYANCTLSEEQVLDNFRRAYNTNWGRSPIRYVGDGRPFWSAIVSESVQCAHPEMLEGLYQYFARGSAYNLAPGAADSISRLRSRGIKTAVVSNFDTRLHRILSELKVDHLFDAIIVSADVHAEKPNPLIFEAAFQALALPPSSCIHVGDDRRNDIFGARDSGCWAWLWGEDVKSFAEVERRIETSNFLGDLD